MSRFSRLQSRFLGAAVAWCVRRTGGHCEVVDDLRVCRTGRVKLYARGGTQWGDVFVTGDRPVGAGLLAHERFHRDEQWRRFGLAFAAMYAWAQVRDVWIGDLPLNRYELAAEEASDYGGGYPRFDR
ncbi:hypothetical protein [Stackebrandtia soli]|uniref:hypothetical protein n=1 Tax=Stackebrandtia soli TaxID=1892856 RepID=UPI0039E8B5E2